MINRSLHVPRLKLLIPAGSIHKYTTLLQAGIFVESSSKTTVKELLSSLPGFTSHYIRERVETIFLNGLPVDDVETVIDSPSPVLALSAAMPGLAGAIFRKNSFHAALRTSASPISSSRLQSAEKIMVLLKFFNMIASERGGTLLHNGCQIKSDSVFKFIRYRPQLVSAILSLSYNDEPADSADLESLLHKSETVLLRIQEDNVTI